MDAAASKRAAEIGLSLDDRHAAVEPGRQQTLLSRPDEWSQPAGTTADYDR